MAVIRIHRNMQSAIVHDPIAGDPQGGTAGQDAADARCRDELAVQAGTRVPAVTNPDDIAAAQMPSKPAAGNAVAREFVSCG